MDIHGDQIATQFGTYGAPPEVVGFFASHDIDPSKLAPDQLPAHGVRAVKELMAYTTGTQVVLAIAALALGEMEASEHGAGIQYVPQADVEDEDQGAAALAEDPLDRNGVPLEEGMRVSVCLTDANGNGIEGAGLAGEIDRIEQRGAVNVVMLQTDPEPGHTEGTLIGVRAVNVEVAVEEKLPKKRGIFG